MDDNADQFCRGPCMHLRWSSQLVVRTGFLLLYGTFRPMVAMIRMMAVPRGKAEIVVVRDLYHSDPWQ